MVSNPKPTPIMQLRNGTKYSMTTFVDFRAASLAISDVKDSRLYTSYKMFRHINSEFPQMYHKMDSSNPYNRGRNLYVVAAYQKCTELITTLLEQAYARETPISDLHKDHIVKTFYELNQTQMIMRRLIWETVVKDEEVKFAMDCIAIDETKFETKLYRCLMHMYDIDSNNAAASYGWFDKYKPATNNDSYMETYTNVEIYDYYYSGRGYAEDDTYIMSYNQCFVQQIESLNPLYWM
jgi:hypothetical protein